MLSATDLRKGTIFEHQGTVYQVVDYKHSHISRRAADIKVKVKDLIKGSALSLSIQPSAKFDRANISRKKMQFLYKEGEKFHFMDPLSFEQVTFSKVLVGDSGSYLKEGEETTVIFWEDKAIGLELAKAIVYQVKETPPNEKGNSASNVYKPATLENGLQVKVPLFIKIGDRVKVDTRTGEYLERAK